MSSIVFVIDISLGMNIDMAENILHTDEKQREYMHSYGTGRKRTEHDHTNMLA